MRRKQLEEDYNDCWIYILLLTTLTILIQSIKSYKFSLMGASISYNVFLLPGVFFLANYICKKYDYKKAIAAIAISGVVFVSFMVMMGFSMGRGLILSSLVGDFCGYIVSQFINLTIYIFLLNNKSLSLFLIFLISLFKLYFLISNLLYDLYINEFRYCYIRWILDQIFCNHRNRGSTFTSYILCRQEYSKR